MPIQPHCSVQRLIVIIGFMACVGCSRQMRLDANTDVFLSYLQSANALATQLLYVKSTAEFQANQHDFKMAVDEWQRLETSFQQLPDDVIDGLKDENETLVLQTQQVCVQLTQQWKASHYLRR